MRALLVICALSSVVASVAPAASARPLLVDDVSEQHPPLVDGPHIQPVDAPVVDPFRPPDHPYGPGNRGLEYDTHVGQPVRASAPGVVTFAGQVGGNLFVTVRHTPHLLTTVGYVTEIRVAVGQRVGQGDVLAVAGETLHFSARRDGVYINPELLFQRYRTVVRLVSAPT